MIRILALLPATFSALHAADKKPNVVLIRVDHFGHECVTANGGEGESGAIVVRRIVRNADIRNDLTEPGTRCSR